MMETSTDQEYLTSIGRCQTKKAGWPGMEASIPSNDRVFYLIYDIGNMTAGAKFGVALNGASGTDVTRLMSEAPPYLQNDNGAIIAGKKMSEC